MNIFELKKKKSKSILFSALFFILTAAMYVFGGLIGNNNVLFYIPALISSICCICFIFRYMVDTSDMAKRIDHLIYSEMDPALLEEELPEQMKALGKGSAADRQRYFYESMKLQLLGDFEVARTQLMKASLHPSILIMKMKPAVAVCNLRTGRIEQAESICLTFEKNYPNIGHLIQDGSDTHAVALYYLERNDFVKARRFLYGAMKQPTNNFSLLNIQYDLARLEEKQGNVEVAIEHCRQAAAIGPKTWLGQESARRVDALLHTVPQAEEAEATP